MKCFIRLAVYGKCQYCANKNRNNQVNRVKKGSRYLPYSYGIEPDTHHFKYCLSVDLESHAALILKLSKKRLVADEFLR